MAVALPHQESKTQDCLTTSGSGSFTGAWSSLFTSFSEQHVPVQRRDTTHLTFTPTEAADSISRTAAAVHQSAVFAALFEDMIASKACDALLDAQLSQAASSHSSAVSLCDSAASFSFKTAMRNQAATDQHSMSSTLQPHTVAGGSPNPDKADLSCTLKDWQRTTDLQYEPRPMELVLQPPTAGKAGLTSRAQRASQPRSFHRQATRDFQSVQQAGLAAAPTADETADTILDDTDCPQVVHASKCGQASTTPSKRVRGKSEAAQH